jgi:hypothetical protein
MQSDQAKLEYIADRFGDGECGPFAIALNRITGLPIVLFLVDGFHSNVMRDGFRRHAAVVAAFLRNMRLKIGSGFALSLTLIRMSISTRLVI